MQSTTLSDGWHKLLVTVHIAAGVGALGADLALLALCAERLGGADPALIYPAASIVAAGVVAPLAPLALVTGVTLALLTRWGLFTYWWVTIKLVIATGASAALLLFLVPALQRQAAAVTGTAPNIISNGIPLVVATSTASVLIAIALALAVFKPGWRLWSGVTGTPAKAREGA
jgi:hypothetical protein